MSQIVVDTDVSSYIVNWHSLAQQYVDALRGSELILSFMTIAELRMGSISAGWGNRRRLLLEQFMQRFELVYADNNPIRDATVRERWRSACPANAPLRSRLGLGLQSRPLPCRTPPYDGIVAARRPIM